MAVAELVYHYDTLDFDQLQHSFYSLPRRTRKQSSYASLLSHSEFIMASCRDRQDSVRTDSSSTSPIHSTFDSPASVHTSPTFYSSSDFKHATTHNNHANRPAALPPFSVANLQTLMAAPSKPVPRTPRPWYTRRALSKIDLTLEMENRAEGLEALGLDLFEPRPRETMISRQSTQGNVILDGIMEVMSSSK